MSLSDSADPTKEDVLAQLRAVMESEFGLHPEQIELATHLIDDLDLDSIDFVDIAVSLEESTGVRLGEEELKAVRTVEDAVDAIAAQLAQRRARSA